MLQTLQEWGSPPGDFDFAPMRGEMMFQPAFDLKETSDAYVLRADLPGVQIGDVDVSVTANRLSISGTRPTSDQQAGEVFHACELNYGNFLRTVTLPEGADVDHIKASMNNGVLELTIPKHPDVQPKRVKIDSMQKQPEPIGAKTEKRGNGGEPRR
ncbi:MAG: Hsp20/alpha crystallin family protein [Deltaproteobacteria bacterium]|nr:Hsp20/alpha crystallin family protein [Deltaproteobacteria bacterium]